MAISRETLRKRRAEAEAKAAAKAAVAIFVDATGSLQKETPVASELVPQPTDSIASSLKSEGTANGQAADKLEYSKDVDENAHERHYTHSKEHSQGRMGAVPTEYQEHESEKREWKSNGKGQNQAWKNKDNKLKRADKNSRNQKGKNEFIGKAGLNSYNNYKIQKNKANGVPNAYSASRIKSNDDYQRGIRYYGDRKQLYERVEPGRFELEYTALHYDNTLSNASPAQPIESTNSVETATKLAQAQPAEPAQPVQSNVINQLDDLLAKPKKSFPQFPKECKRIPFSIYKRLANNGVCNF